MTIVRTHKGLTEITGNTAVTWRWWVKELLILWTWTRTVRWVSEASGDNTLSIHYSVQNVNTHTDSASALRTCLQNYSNVVGATLKWDEVVEQECRSGQPPYNTTPRGEQQISTPCFSVWWWWPIVCALVSSGNQGMSENCAPYLARHSGLLQTCSALDKPWNSEGEQWHCFAAAEALLNRYQMEGDDFLGRIVAMDETWAD